MNPIDEVWAHLSKISVVYFKARSHSGIGWDGSGSGIVKVSRPAPDVLVFDESGHFRKPDGKEMSFVNVFRWTRREDNLGLEHLRFGEGAPVFLFDMSCDEDGTWRELIPHPCRDDCYSATLRVENGIVFVHWSVNGPERNEEIHYTYI
ncbi:MAG TPA: DUF6314 family protein [Abditibacteriaceae bacterium]|jgi:hypothetical protein